MANFNLPRRGCNAAKALASLQGMGGVAIVSSLKRVSGLKCGTASFQLDVIERLQVAGLAVVDGDEIRITRAGQQYLGVSVKPDAGEGIPAGPRYVAPFQPRVQRSKGPLVIRDGALDFRAYPSRFGDCLVPYRSAVATSSG
ncbi:MAG: hypothetical protein K2X55_21460 [Burkholderiaceae bacterium]|nr:hypothetical protein [Burkholderiaceae bacterium]